MTRHGATGGGGEWRRRGLLVLTAAMCLAGSSGAQGNPALPAPTPGSDGKPSQVRRPSATPASPTDKAPLPEVTGGKAKEANPAPPLLPTPQPAAGEVLDRVIAVVNGDVILESDVDEERRFAAFQPVSAPGGDFTRKRAIERLINRDLILQQAKLQPQPAITDEAVEKELSLLRAESPACKDYHCETEAGWQRFVAAQGYTIAELTERWRQRMEALRFIELRFRGGVHIPQEEITAYYTKTLVPEYSKRGIKVPKLDEAISERIQEVLLQEQVSSLLGDWLKSLRAQGSVEIMKADGTGPA